MNFSDFKRLLGADPYSQDPEFLRARNSSDEFSEAAEAAEAFEIKLHQALKIETPENLTSEILEQVYATPRKGVNTWPMALAASVFMMVGAAAVFMWQQERIADLEAYVFDHYQLDGSDILDQAHGRVSIEQIQAIMASVNASAGEQLAKQVYFIKNCPTPDGTGAHLVLMTDMGPVTVFYLPATEVRDVKSFEMPGMYAYVVNLKHGAAAVIGPSTDSVQSVARLLDTGILPAGAINT